MSSRRPTSSDSNRTPSINQAAQQHAPTNPSGLREAHTLSQSPESLRDAGVSGSRTAVSSSNPSPNTYPTHLDTDPAADDDAIDGRAHGFAGLGSRAVGETTSLLRKPFEFATHTAHAGPCDHGTFSPRLESRTGSIRSSNDFGFGGSPPRGSRETSGESSSSMFGSLLEGIGLKNGTGAGKKKMSTTQYLAERHGVKNTTTMYVLKIISLVLETDR